MVKRFFKNKYLIFTAIVLIITCIIIAIVIISFRNESYAMNENSFTNNTNNTSQSNLNIDLHLVKQDDSKIVDVSNIISENEKEILTEKICNKETDIEFNTKYRENKSLAKGKMQTIQEGQDGRQNAIIKEVYKNGELISSKTISTEITKASIDKIVEIGTGSFSNNYVPIVGDTLQVTSTTASMHMEANATSEKMMTLNKEDKVILKETSGDWYKVQYNSYTGYIEKTSLAYVNPNGNSDGDENNIQYSKEQLTQDIGFSMLLNKKSNLSLSQFKKILSNDSNDKNSIFNDNAEYFYYAEQQYNINGVFVAAIAIHESGWGTSQIALNKKNLFGYQAYDSNPYSSAAEFETYAEGIDLISRVLVKYYINAAGTQIYGGEKAVGTYYKGSTLTAVNQTYASDKNWANGIYKWMVYLYNKL